MCVAGVVIVDILLALGVVGDNFTFGLFKVGIEELQFRIGNENVSALVGDILKVGAGAVRGFGGGGAIGLGGADGERGPPSPVSIPWGLEHGYLFALTPAAKDRIKAACMVR